MKKIALALHGGAGTLKASQFTPELENTYKTALLEALHIGHSILLSGGTALDAVEATVRSLEDCPLFNAGRGSVFTSAGTNEMDASIMDGLTREAGAVSMVECVRHPISLARLVMEKSGHVMLAGAGAQDFAQEMAVEMMPAEWFHTDLRYQQWQKVKGSDETALDHNINPEKKFGTVGAVALDEHGNLAAATSTGGMTNKKYGRIGDSPIIGAGTYANNATCAVSCTGSGEYFIRGVVAYDVSCMMEMKGLSLAEAGTEVVMNRLEKIGGDGGLISVDAQGNISMPFNTDGMYRAAVGPDGVEQVAIFKE